MFYRTRIWRISRMPCGEFSCAAAPLPSKGRGAQRAGWGLYSLTAGEVLTPPLPLPLEGRGVPCGALFCRYTVNGGLANAKSRSRSCRMRGIGNAYRGRRKAGTRPSFHIDRRVCQEFGTQIDEFLETNFHN